MDKFEDYVKLGFYKEAHKILLNKFWTTGNKLPHNLYYKGLLNGVAAMELIRLGRVEQGKKVWQTYLKYKIPSYFEINHRMEKQYEKTLNIW